MFHMKAALAQKKLALKEAKPSSNGSGLHERVRKVEAGLHFRELEALRQDLDLPLDQLSEKLGISRATMHRRKASGRLGPDESDRVVRFERLLKQAATVFGSTESARQWLGFPQWGLGGAVPLDYARTEVGAREVENLLGRIEWGVLS
jgi:putative toxin-antitoxin system antitoxin component (TIGR02293 family)